MNSGFKAEDFSASILQTKSKDNIKDFLNDLRDLLDNYDVKLYSNDCEVYIKGRGYIGYLEDNIETIDIVEGEETLYSSLKTIEIKS